MTSGAAAKKSPSVNMEYTVYSFESAGKKARNRWRRHDTLPEKDTAVDLARTLYASGRYQRIEVKRRHFDRRINRHVDTTYKTYETRKRLRLGLSAIFIFASVCGAIAFAACSLAG